MEDHENQEPINTLAAALAAAQGEMPDAVLDCKNPHFNSRYASLSSIWNACREPLSKNGLSIVQGVVVHPQWELALESTLMHSSGQFVTYRCPLIVDKKNMQGLGSAITYAKRYSLATLVGVVDSEDDDGNAAKEAPPKKQGGAAPTPAPTQNTQTKIAPQNSEPKNFNAPPAPPPVVPEGESFVIPSGTQEGKKLRQFETLKLEEMLFKLEGIEQKSKDVSDLIRNIHIVVDTRKRREREAKK